jgi:hypothetical protein
MARLTRQQYLRNISINICWQTGAKQIQYVKQFGLLPKQHQTQTFQVTLTSATGAQFVFPVKPEFPTAGGSGIDAQDSIIHLYS